MSWRDCGDEEHAATGPALGEWVLLGLLRLVAVPLIVLAVLIMALVHGVGFVVRRAAAVVAFISAHPRRPERACDQR